MLNLGGKTVPSCSDMLARLEGYGVDTYLKTVLDGLKRHIESVSSIYQARSSYRYRYTPSCNRALQRSSPVPIYVSILNIDKDIENL